MLVDWPDALRGAPYLDPVHLLVNVRLFGGLDTTAVLRRVAARYDVPLDDLVSLLVGMAGYFLDATRSPAPPGLPTVRRFQRQQGDAVLGWLEELL